MADEKTRVITDGYGESWTIEKNVRDGEKRSPSLARFLRNRGPTTPARGGTFDVYCNVRLKSGNYERNGIYYIIEV